MHPETFQAPIDGAPVTGSISFAPIRCRRGMRSISMCRADLGTGPQRTVDEDGTSQTGCQ